MTCTCEWCDAECEIVIGESGPKSDCCNDSVLDENGELIDFVRWAEWLDRGALDVQGA